MIPSGYNDFHKSVDVFGYNYKPFEYEKFHAANPAQPLSAVKRLPQSARAANIFPGDR